MKQLMLLFFSFCISCAAIAQESNDALFNKGVKAFDSNEYQTAATVFNELTKVDSLNATLHYNLGTSYLKLQNTGLSIYHLEKALKLQPSYEAARVNLNFAEKLKTKITKGNLPIPQQQMLYSVFNFLTPNTWAYLTIVFTILGILGLIAFKFNSNITAKKVLFVFAIALFISSISSYFISKNQSNYLLDSHYVIVKESNVNLMQEPRAVAKIAATLPEGEKAFIKETTDQWVKIQLQNDTIGWVERNNVLKF